MPNYMRTLVNSSTNQMTRLAMFAVLLLLMACPAITADDKLTPAKEITDKLKKAGDKHEIKADDSGSIDVTLTIGGKAHKAVAHVGEKGSIVWSLEEFDDGDKKVTALVLRFNRPDKDNPSLMFKTLAPEIEQLALTVRDDQDYGANVYTGVDKGGDEPEDGKVRNMWSSMGNYGDKAAPSKLFYVTPAYKNDKDTAEGTRGLFISAVPQPTTPPKVGIVFGLTKWKAKKKD